MKKQYYWLFLFCLTVIGCEQQDHVKSVTQSQLNKKFAVCYSLGINDFKYPVDIIDVPKPNSFDYDFNKTAKVFKIFTALGFLTEEPFEVNYPEQNSTQIGYRYNITLEGEKYYSRHAFCFGKVVIENILQVKDIEYVEYLGNIPTGRRPDTGRIIEYQYTVDNVPEWANLPELIELYDLTIHFDGSLNEGSLGTESRGTSLATRTSPKQLFKASEE